jgi:hypothetical protein
MLTDSLGAGSNVPTSGSLLPGERMALSTYPLAPPPMSRAMPDG